MSALVVALVLALVIALAALGGVIGYAATCRRRAAGAEASAARWREATQARSRSGLGETEVFAAVTDDVGWTEAEQLLTEK